MLFIFCGKLPVSLTTLSHVLPGSILKKLHYTNCQAFLFHLRPQWNSTTGINYPKMNKQKTKQHDLLILIL